MVEEAIIEKLRKYCIYQDRCHQEVRYKLIGLKVYGDDLEEVISILVSENFVNEERFAKSFVRGKNKIKKWGRNKIIQELKQKQISPYCIRKGLEEIDEEDYLQNLAELTEKKISTYKDLGYKTTQKLTQYLMRKGYEYDLVKGAIDEIRDRANS